jgi:glycerate kinase
MLYHIDMTGIDARIEEARIQVACDVDNRLTGKEGAALVFGPQKGAKPTMARKLEDNLLHLSRVIAEELGKNLAALKGGGAAGGMGAGMAAFLGGELKPGFGLVSQLTGLEKWIEWADLVITGEGRIDTQTAYGKTPAGVARLAERQNKPVMAFTGSLDNGIETLSGSAISVIIPVTNKPMTLDQSLNQAGKLLADAGARTARIIKMALSLLENQVK